MFFQPHLPTLETQGSVPLVPNLPFKSPRIEEGDPQKGQFKGQTELANGLHLHRLASAAMYGDSCQAMQHINTS